MTNLNRQLTVSCHAEERDQSGDARLSKNEGDMDSRLNEERKVYHTIHDIGVASQIAAYSDAVEVSPNLRWLLTSGTPGLSADGGLPDDIAGQAEIAGGTCDRHVGASRNDSSDIIKVTQYLTRAEDIPAYGKVRTRFLGTVRPASMLLIIPQLVRPEFLVEVEIVAARV